MAWCDYFEALVPVQSWGGVNRLFSLTRISTFSPERSAGWSWFPCRFRFIPIFGCSKG